MKAPFITFEGGEGVGKSTQVGRLTAWLREARRPVIGTREPGGSAGAEMLRDMLLRTDQTWSPLAETLLHFAARAEHVAHTIRPALESGTWVVCDRFTDSTRAYQGYGQGAPLGDIDRLHALVGLDPDLTIVLEASPAVARERMERRGRTDRYERLGPAFFARVEDGFRRIAAAEPARCVVVGADGTEDDVAACVLSIVRGRFG